LLDLLRSRFENVHGMETNDKPFEKVTNPEREELFEKVIRAGKRTYFFDIRSTRDNDHYITITESKKRYNEDGTHYYQKHKVFLYKEDFEKFSSALGEAVKKIIELNKAQADVIEEKIDDVFSDIKFEDLGDGQHLKAEAPENKATS